MPIHKRYRPLLDYLQNNYHIKDIQGFNDSILHIWSRKVLKMITSDEKGWEELVPKSVASTINDKCLFGHPCFKK